MSSVLLCNRKSIQGETVRKVCENFQYLDMGIFVHILSGREKIMYIYESHMGGLFVSDTYLSCEELYCETCGDLDFLIGYAATKKEAWNLLKNDTDIDGSGGWNHDYVQEFINSNWDS